MSIDAKNEKIRNLTAALAKEEADHLDTIRHRDFCEKWADKLAYAVGGIELIGEHSNLNNPWETAYNLMRSHAEFEKLEKRVAALDEFLKYGGVEEKRPFDRLVMLIDEQGQRCRNQDDRDYWRYLKEKLMRLASSDVAKAT